MNIFPSECFPLRMHQHNNLGSSTIIFDLKMEQQKVEPSPWMQRMNESFIISFTCNSVKLE